MGHDIFGILNEDEVAYLRRSAGNELNTVIYNVLEKEECNAGCSGNGDSCQVTKEELSQALAKLALLAVDLKISKEIKFIADCLEALEDSDQDELTIAFC